MLALSTLKHPWMPSTRCKLLYVIDTLELGGAERSLLDIVRQLDRDRFEPVVCHVYRGDALKSCFEATGARVVSLENEGKYKLIRGAKRLSSLIRSERPALLHTSLFRADQIGRLAGRWTKTPVISSFVNTSYEPIRLVDNPHLSRWKLDGLRRCDALTSRWVTRFHAVSNTVRDSNCRHLGIAPTRVEVVPRGRTLERFEVPADEVALLRQNLMLGDADPLLLCVGRLIDQKGHRYLLQAMPEILKAFPKAKLLIAGEGWKRAELEATGRDLGIAPNVRFLGSRTDIPQLLAAADVFVFPSLFEGMPGAVIEAMLAGKPIVASDIPQIQEVVTDCKTALLVPPREPAALSTAIVRLVRDRELCQRLAKSARNSARESYDIRNVTQAMEKLYEEVMRGKKLEARS